MAVDANPVKIVSVKKHLKKSVYQYLVHAFLCTLFIDLYTSRPGKITVLCCLVNDVK